MQSRDREEKNLDCLLLCATAQEPVECFLEGRLLLFLIATSRVATVDRNSIPSRNLGAVLYSVRLPRPPCVSQTNVCAYTQDDTVVVPRNSCSAAFCETVITTAERRIDFVSQEASKVPRNCARYLSSVFSGNGSERNYNRPSCVWGDGRWWTTRELHLARKRDAMMFNYLYIYYRDVQLSETFYYLSPE